MNEVNLEEREVRRPDRHTTNNNPLLWYRNDPQKRQFNIRNMIMCAGQLLMFFQHTHVFLLRVVIFHSLLEEKKVHVVSVCTKQSYSQAFLNLQQNF
jgi:hypothetical protein